jgi:hypothetical protein
MLAQFRVVVQKEQRVSCFAAGVFIKGQLHVLKKYSHALDMIF